MGDMCGAKQNAFSIEAIKKEDLKFDDMFDEIPIRIRNSPLSSVLLTKLHKEDPVPEKVEYLNLSHTSSLEHQMRLMMTSVDELTQESGKFVQYQRAVAKAHLNMLPERREENHLCLMKI